MTRDAEHCVSKHLVLKKKSTLFHRVHCCHLLKPIFSLDESAQTEKSVLILSVPALTEHRKTNEDDGLHISIFTITYHS